MKNKIWKYVTAFVVVLIMLNPETIELALFIDAVGLEMFLLLLEIQILAVLGTYQTKIRQFFTCLAHTIKRCIAGAFWPGIKSNPGLRIFIVLTPAGLMNALVLFYIFLIILVSIQK